MHRFFTVEDFVAFFNLQKSQHNYAGTCVSIGNFDGVHMGHQALLRRTTYKAAEQNLLPVVLTFWPHPLTVLAKSRAPSLLINRKCRAHFIGEQGIKCVFELEFTPDIAALNPEEFIKKVLCPLQCKELVVGYDFSLGKGRSGNFEILQALGQSHGFGVERLSPIIVHNAVVSSTRIRQMLRSGEVYEVEALLGRYYHLEGKIIHGFGRGEGLGFPTANLEVSQNLLLRHGVYVTWLTVERLPDGTKQTQVYPAVTNVGHVPTFGNTNISVESFILQGNPNLYDAEVRLNFVQYLRPEQQFANVGELKERINKDVLLAKEILDITEN